MALGVIDFTVDATARLVEDLQQRAGPGDLELAQRRMLELLEIAPPSAHLRLKRELIELLHAMNRGADAVTLAATIRDSEPAPPMSIKVTGRVLDEGQAGRECARRRAETDRDLSRAVRSDVTGDQHGRDRGRRHVRTTASRSTR